MTEKFINVLLTEFTCVSILYTILLDEAELTWCILWPIVLYAMLFGASLIWLFSIVQPLSHKAKNPQKTNVARKSNKKRL